MYIKKFEDILAWQKAQDLAVKVYGHFSKFKDFGFRDQITKASVSITNNISEDFDRKTNPDFKRFLYFAMGSNSEVRSVIFIQEVIFFNGRGIKVTYSRFE